ncbi:MAG: CoA transferase [Planctomycetota bacterium]|nr:CoA transferase [Planctomycetota bacterium]MDA1105139.1 CoA transferase [Planctomycetota bacterium]
MADLTRPPLAGVTIIDLSRVLAGPYCTMVLARLGARVIKVEMPGTGDDARAIGPFANGKSLYFSAINFDKESIALDLKAEADREIFDGLLAMGDVLVENYRPGTMDRLGYGVDAVRAKHPSLIYASTNGFGSTGPYADRAAYDIVVQGMGGVMSVTGHEGSPPTRVGVSIGDMTAGLYLALGIVSALLTRAQDAERRGTHVEVAMLDAQLALLEGALTSYHRLGKVAGPEGSRHPSIAPFQAFQTADRHIIIAAGNDRLFSRLCAVLDRADLASDERFNSNRARREHIDELQEEMERTLRSHPASEWLAKLTAAGVPCGPINTVEDVARDPQVAARNMIHQVEDPIAGMLHVVGNPIRMAGVAESTTHRPSPELDADRERVVADSLGSTSR